MTSERITSRGRNFGYFLEKATDDRHILQSVFLTKIFHQGSLFSPKTADRRLTFGRLVTCNFRHNCVVSMSTY